MGCTTSTTAKKSPINGSNAAATSTGKVGDVNSSNQVKSTLLTDDQKAIIMRTWRSMNGETQHGNAVLLGKKIFLRIFELTPDIKQLFPFRAVWGDELLNHPHFQAHAARFMQVIIGAIEHLDYLDTSFAENIYILGKAHAYRKGFTMKYFDTFLTAILFIWKQELRGNYSEEIEISWDIVLRFIINTLKEGYENEMNLLSKGKSPSMQQNGTGTGNGNI